MSGLLVEDMDVDDQIEQLHRNDTYLPTRHDPSYFVRDESNFMDIPSLHTGKYGKHCACNSFLCSYHSNLILPYKLETTGSNLIRMKESMSLLVVEQLYQHA